MEEELVLVDAEVVVEEVEELLLHEVDLCLGEEGAVAGPVLVLWRRVVEVLCCDDEGCEEDAVACAVHALCDAREPVLQAVEVYEGAEEGGYLYVALLHEDGNERLEAGEAIDLELAGGVALGVCHGARGRRGGRGEGLRRAALDDVCCLLCEVDWGGEGGGEDIGVCERDGRVDEVVVGRAAATHRPSRG